VQDEEVGILPVIEYYKEFNRTQEYMNDMTLLMLDYFGKHGDENVKCYQFRLMHATKQLPKDL